MRKRRLFLNTTSSLLYEVVTIISGFILPHLILNSFGSTVNGLLSSITQFLGFITLMEMGVGAVIQSSLYGPLARLDNDGVSAIMTSARKFFRTIALVLALYVVVLCFIYPYISESEFDTLYTAALIVIISIGFFAQYVFGIVDRLLLTSDQRGYIVYSVNICTTVLNTILCIVFVKLGMNIHGVKLFSSLVFLMGPVLLHFYIRKHYSINYKIKYTEEPIKQKWNGIAQHVAAVVLDGTDVAVLTAFSTLSNVSIYSIYNLVIRGVTRLTLSMTNGIQSLMGEMLSKKETDNLHSFFGWTEWAIHTGTVFIFGCCAVLIVPFVQVYTKTVSDANYFQPLFGILLTLANAGHCLRLPYNMMILAGGHYKQTQSCYIIAAVLNLSISILAVHTMGLIGVTIGTLVAMLYQTVWMALYISRNLIKWPFRLFLRQFFVDVISFSLAFIFTINIPMFSCNMFSWIALAIVDCIIWIAIIIIINYMFYRNHIRTLLHKLKLKK